MVISSTFPVSDMADDMLWRLVFPLIMENNIAMIKYVPCYDQMRTETAELSGMYEQNLEASNR